MPNATIWKQIYTKQCLLYPCGLPCSWRMVWCGLQCTAPMAFPAQLFHSPWRTQVAVMTEDARLVALHSLDTVAPIVAPSPARPLMKARICRADIWSFKIFFKQVQEKEKKWKLLQADKLHCGHVFHWDDLQTRHLAWPVMDTGVPEWNSKREHALTVRHYILQSKLLKCLTLWSKNKSKYHINTKNNRGLISNLKKWCSVTKSSH